MLLKQAMLFDFLRDGSWILGNQRCYASEGASLVKFFFNDYALFQRHMLLISRGWFAIHKYLLLLRIRDTKNDKG